MAARCSCQCVTAFMVALAVFALLFVNIAGIVTVIIVFVDGRTANYTDYGIVIDAGSSHSALWMFSWDGRKVNNTGVISTYDLHDGQAAGISHYAGNASAAAASLRPLLDYSHALLGDVDSRTWIFLGATAGMRILNDSSPTEATNIMNAVESYLKSEAYHFGKSAVISGQEEALNGWIAVNYLKKDIGVGAEQTDTSFGSVDFGGASLEIAFASSPQPSSSSSSSSSPPLDADFFQVTLYNRSHQLYAHSYLCFGRDQMELRLLTGLYQPGSATLLNPCFPEGYSTSARAEDLWRRPCVTTPGPGEGSVVTINGTADPEQCRRRVERLFPSVPCQHSSCGINGSLQPPPNGTFYGTGLLKFVVSNVYGVHDLSSTSPKEWQLLTDRVDLDCNSTLKELKERHRASGMNDSYLHQLCFNGQLVLSTLQSGLKFSLNSSSAWALNFTGSVDSVPIDWPLGYMLQTTAGIAAPARPYAYDPPLGTLDMVLSEVLLCMIAVALLFLLISSVRVCKLMMPGKMLRVGYATLD